MRYPLQGALVALIGGLLAAPPAEADFHIVQIDELMAGAGGDASIQFIEIGLNFGQNCQGTGSHIDIFNLASPCVPLGSGATLLFFDAAGIQTAEFVFPANTPVGEAGRSILIGTQAFAALSSTPQPDFLMPPHVIPASGKVCYKNRPGAFFFASLCLSYGAFTGDTEGFGRPATALPTGGSMSLQRVDPFGFDNATSFALGTPTPRNNAGVEGGVSTLSLTKSDSPDPATAGNPLVYTLTATNSASGPATGVTITDALPPGLVLVSATPSQGSCGGTGTVTCALGEIPGGGSASVAIVVTPATAGRFANAATVAADGTVPSGDEEATAICQGSGPFRLSGIARTADGRRVRGARVILQDAGGCQRTTRTNRNGRYRFSGLADGSYTVTPTRRGCRFRPVVRTVEIAGRNRGPVRFRARCR